MSLAVQRTAKSNCGELGGGVVLPGNGGVVVGACVVVVVVVGACVVVVVVVVVVAVVVVVVGACVVVVAVAVVVGGACVVVAVVVGTSSLPATPRLRSVVVLVSERAAPTLRLRTSPIATAATRSTPVCPRLSVTPVPRRSARSRSAYGSEGVSCTSRHGPR
jgi:hypothetical protein